MEIPTACVFALVGPNGSGKSTLLRCLMQLTYPDDGGTIHIRGMDIRSGANYRAQLGYMPQVPLFPRNLTAREIIGYLEALAGGGAPHRDRLIRDLGMESFLDRPFGEFSQGMRQKVNLLQCFMFDHPLLVIDEPTAALDPPMAWYLKNLIRERRSAGGTILFTSHIMSEVEELADNMAVLVDGRVVLKDTPEAIKSAAGDASLEAAVRHFWRQGITT